MYRLFCCFQFLGLLFYVYELDRNSNVAFKIKLNFVLNLLLDVMVCLVAWFG